MNQELKEKFRKKIEQNYAEHTAEWRRQPQEALIRSAYQIWAMGQIAEILAKTADEREIAYLMQFKDPLKIVTEAWAFEKEYEFDFDEQLSAVLFDLTDRCDADGFYERESPDMTM